MRSEMKMPKPVAAPAVLPSPGKLWISETFTSRQGEGKLTGTTSFFIRTSGCNLRCWFCDTPYASWQPTGEWLAIDRLVDLATQTSCGHVVVTGGEPLLPLGITELVRQLRSAGLHVTIETAGTRFRDVPTDLVSISPKLASSGPQQATSRLAIQHHGARWRPDVIARLIANSLDHQVKFVVDDEADFDEVLMAVDQLQIAAEHVWIMPQATEADQLDAQALWLVPLCQRHGFRYCDRMHIRWYGNRRGT